MNLQQHRVQLRRERLIAVRAAEPPGLDELAQRHTAARAGDVRLVVRHFFAFFGLFATVNGVQNRAEQLLHVAAGDVHIHFRHAVGAQMALRHGFSHHHGDGIDGFILMAFFAKHVGMLLSGFSGLVRLRNAA